MSVPSRLANALTDPAIKIEVNRTAYYAQAANGLPLVEAATASTERRPIDPDEYLYRRLSDMRTDDLPEWQHTRMLSVALMLDRRNGVARRILDLIRDFVFGEGFTVEAHNTAVDEALKRHIEDEVNAWDERGPKTFRQTMRDGEILVTHAVNPFSGLVRYGTIPARQIKEVFSDPTNWEIKRRVELRPELGQEKGRTLEVINADLITGRLAGEAFYWHLNDDGDRGISVLFPFADYLDALDRLMFSEVERWMFLKAFVWHVTMEGYTQEQIDAERKNNPALFTPKPGSVQLTNEKVNWEAVAPDIGAADAVAAMKWVRDMILGGFGIPEHWYATGGDVNRAVGTVMDQPTLKMLTRWQNTWKRKYERALRFQIDTLVNLNLLPAMVEHQDEQGEPSGQGLIPAREAFDVNTPDMATRDLAGLTKMLKDAIDALSVATNDHIITEQTARIVFLMLLSQVGIERDANEEAEEAEKERKEDEERMVNGPGGVVDRAQQILDARRQGSPAENRNGAVA